MPFCRQLASFPIVVATMMAAALGGCGNAVPDKPAASAKSATSAAPRFNPGPTTRAPATRLAHYDAPFSAENASSFEVVNQHADPQMQMAALEVWAAGAKEDLDPVTYALVDPDDAVRTRAQELLEQELARR